nr:unnamed protein product [Spirometra erinaceieuropaei]
MPAVVVEDGAARTEKFIDSIDPDDPEYVRQIIRPAEIKEDLNLMEQRQRVSRVLKSEAFRKELEDVIETFNRSNDSTGLNSSLLSLQHLTELLSVAPGKRPLTGGGFSKGGQSGVIPINDLRGVDASYYSRRERLLRCKLASVYRLIDLFGWNTSIYNHATVRLSRNEEHFLINPFGLLYHEITASSLIKLDSQGQIIDPGSTVLGVSCMKSGLLPLSQEAIILGDVGYYNGTPALSIEHAGDGGSAAAVDVSAERAAISEALGPDTHILFVRCRGLLALGDTIEEAWHYATNAVRACETQDAQLHIFNESGLVEEAILAIRAQIREVAALPADPEMLDPAAAAAADTAAGGLNLKLRPTPLTLSERRVGGGGSDGAGSGASVAGMSIATGSAALSYAAACPLLPSEASLRGACGGFKSSQLSLSSTASSAFSGLTGAVIGGSGGGGIGIGGGGCTDTGQTSSALNGSASTLHSTPATNTSGPACGRSPPFTPPPPQQSFSGVTSPGDSTGAGGDALSLFDAHNADMMSLNSSNSTGFEAPDRTSHLCGRVLEKARNVF